MGLSGEKSSFAVTCNLLSRYIKGRGGLADLGLGSAQGKSETFRPPTTMSLLPGVEVSGDEEKETKVDGVSHGGNPMELFPQRAALGDDANRTPDARELDRAQLTIFYGGKVLVFDNFPAEKAKDLMQFAGMGSSTIQNVGSVPASTDAAAAAAAASHPNGTANQRPALVAAPAKAAAVAVQKPAQPSNSDLPIARRASLHRFLEKRKDRINAKAPYQVTDSPAKAPYPVTGGSPAAAAATKPEECQPWLGLGPQVSKPSLSLSSTSECSR